MSGTKWLDETPRSKRKKSHNQEKRAAKRFGGRTQVASGALSAKGDVKLPIHLMEMKRTDKAHITISVEWLEKIRKEAIVMENRIPVIGLEMGNRRYYIISEEYM